MGAASLPRDGEIGLGRAVAQRPEDDAGRRRVIGNQRHGILGHRAFEKTAAHFVLERAHLPRERRLGDVHLESRLAEAAMLDNGKEGAHQVQIHRRRLCVLCMGTSRPAQYAGGSADAILRP